jgi:hypothetical protein
MRSLFNRSRLWLISMTMGASVLALQGCDPGVRDTVLNGVGSAATGLAGTFIDAFIQSLQEEEETAATVRAIIETVPQFFA